MVCCVHMRESAQEMSQNTDSAEKTKALLKGWWDMPLNAPAQTIRVMVNGEALRENESGNSLVFTLKNQDGTLVADDGNGNRYFYPQFRKMLLPLWEQGKVSLEEIDTHRAASTPQAIGSTVDEDIRESIPSQQDITENEQAPSEFKEALVDLRKNLRIYALALARNKHEADDLVNETCVKALANWQQLKPGTNFPAWAGRILRNTFINTRRAHFHKSTRHNNRYAQSSETDEADEPMDNIGIEGNQIASLTLKQVLDHMEHLSPIHREVLELVARGYSHAEIGAKLGVKEVTVKTRLHRARQNLRELVGHDVLD